MRKMMGTGGVATKESAFANYYQWEEPYSDITVRLSFDTANRLQAEVLESASSIRDVGNEIGGILLGRVEREEGRTVTVIEDFNRVQCKQHEGPFFSLNEKDVRQSRAMLARRKSRRVSGHSVVGYYRSHNREDLFLSAQDLAVIRTCFTDRDNVFLLIKTLPGNVCTAGFFFWNNGQIQSEFTDSEVALIPIGQPELVPIPTEPFDADDGLEGLQPIPSIEAGEHRTTGRRWAIAGAALSAVAAAAVFAALGHHAERPPLRSESHGPMTAMNPAGSQPKVPDKPGAGPAPKIAVGGTAGIQPGKSEQKKALSVAGSPLDRQRDKQSIASLGGASLGVVDHEQESAPRGPDADGPAKSSSSLPLTIAPPEPTSTNSEETKNAPPAIAPVEPVAQATVHLAPDPPQPKGQAQIVPAVPAPITQLGAIPQRVETSFVGPEIIHRVAPAIPLGVGPRITTNIQIDVTVTIDESGKAIGARVTSKSGAAAGLLELEALKAAQLFRFRPAQENNRPVRSDMVLTFRFAPRAQ
jgi:Gram-negative bacterial TonB protein C-terminal